PPQKRSATSPLPPPLPPPRPPAPQARVDLDCPAEPGGTDPEAAPPAGAATPNSRVSPPPRPGGTDPEAAPPAGAATRTRRFARPSRQAGLERARTPAARRSATVPPLRTPRPTRRPARGAVGEPRSCGCSAPPAGSA